MLLLIVGLLLHFYCTVKDQTTLAHQREVDPRQSLESVGCPTEAAAKQLHACAHTLRRCVTTWFIYDML